MYSNQCFWQVFHTTPFLNLTYASTLFTNYRTIVKILHTFYLLDSELSINYPPFEQLGPVVLHFRAPLKTIRTCLVFHFFGNTFLAYTSKERNTNHNKQSTHHHNIQSCCVVPEIFHTPLQRIVFNLSLAPTSPQSWKFQFSFNTFSHLRTH